MSLRRSVLSASVLLTLLWTSCGDGGRGLASAVASSYGERGKMGPVLPAAPSRADLVVRPDLMVVSFSFWKDAASMDGVVAALKDTVDRYVRAAADTTKAELTVRMRGFGTQSIYVGDKPGHQLSVHGDLEVMLPPTLDYWGRAELATTLVRVGEQAAGAAGKANIKASFSPPAVMLKEPEAHRAELMKRWMERARGFVAEAQGERPLQLVDCAPPGEVEQQVVTLEEVVLKLAMNCQLTSAPAGK